MYIPRPAASGADRQLAGQMGLRPGRKGCGLFVPHMDPFDLLVPADLFKNAVEGISYNAMVTGAAAIFRVILLSTFGPENSLTAYNSAASIKGLKLALIWWPFALIPAWFYSRFIARHYSGIVKITHDVENNNTR